MEQVGELLWGRGWFGFADCASPHLLALGTLLMELNNSINMLILESTL